MPKLLFLSPVFPFPMDRGQHLRVANLLAACGRFFDVTFVGPPPPAGAGDRTIVNEVCARARYIDVLAQGPSPLEALRDPGALRWVEALCDQPRRRLRRRSVVRPGEAVSHFAETP